MPTQQKVMAKVQHAEHESTCKLIPYIAIGRSIPHTHNITQVLRAVIAFLWNSVAALIDESLVALRSVCLHDVHDA